MAKATTKARAKIGARRAGTVSQSSGDARAPDVRALARDAALAALTRLAELANSEDERVALAASQELLNRAFGKSSSGTSDDQGGVPQPLVIKIVRFGTEDVDGSRPGAKPASGSRT